MTNLNPKQGFPARVVLVTALITSALCFAFFYITMSGSRGVQETETNHDHGAETLYTCSMHPFVIQKEPGNCPICGMTLVPKTKDAPTEATGERKIAYWKAPMNPREIYKQPGKSAMGMDLVPVYEDELKGGVDIRIDPVTQQSMGIRVEVAQSGPLVHTIRTYGHVTVDETRTAQINPRFSGWVEKLMANVTGQSVSKGQALFTVYSPELISAQEEYLNVYRSHNSGSMLSAIRQRLLNYDIPLNEIRDMEKRNSPKTSLTIYSPLDGIVMDKPLVEGSYFNAGTKVYSISDLSNIWVEAHIYEYELDLVKLGQDAEITLPYHPGKIFRGKVTYIYPYLQQKTRDVVVRLEFENADQMLKPDMFTDVSIRTQKGETGTIIPEEAVLRSGETNLVFVDRGNGKFSPRRVVPGVAMDHGTIHIISGIVPGDRVVVSGQFLLDSESKLKESLRKMTEPEKMPEPVKTEPEADDFFKDMN
ncbi:MAG: efflux RND transporter periplasmic adaptor subunit [Proteobacteria bacterium]|nr:efflux RND transporter periplasmic adaptor subunit [Pseudomonadota bacterium]